MTIKKSSISLAVALTVSACSQTATQTTPASKVTSTLFSEAPTEVIALEQRSRRKWDAPVVADLDQDGYPDLLLTEHGNMVKVYWNNQGVFSEPQKVIGGDTHGLAVEDFDQDGNIELIISMGGGGGKKPSYPRIFEVSRDRTFTAQGEFPLYERTRGRAVKLLDADQDGDMEVVFSAFPLKQQTQGANYLYHNDQGDLQFSSILPQAKWLGYKTTITDFNSDGDADILFHGGDNMVAVQGTAGLGFINASKDVFGKLADISKVRSIAEIDFDNDGDMDLFLTRAKHQFYEERFYDAERQRFAFFVRRQQFQFDDLTIDGDFILENLQMAYPDYDVFVGAEKRQLTFARDKVAERQLQLSPEQAQGWPETIKAKGLYIGYLGDGQWRVGGDTTSPTAGVIHNVTSTPATIEPERLPAKLLENRGGKFIDVSAQLGINIPEQTVSAVAGDFNNDGWSDLFVVRVGNMATSNKQILLLNDQGQGFRESDNHGLISAELGATGSGAEAIDYDLDGDLDLLYANERGRWHLYTNQLASDNQFVRVIVGKSPQQNASALSATLTLTACNNQYVRTVGANSSSFSHGNNNQLHVGLGDCNKVDAAQVRWSNGEQAKLDISTLNSSYYTGK
ncbi:CRTAC1 family protein [Thalassotalea mangrovi]|uniref:CRTAC1 family protein n=1 Tax=Thalassotalea mangrovi TaxID=2572245 RepID=A0A4U1B1D0_9GAMM|nr:CRTAC1 family protein [Thalassotalea mangrovi]TKB43061.1 CRTAC1 family protein [Thalassotalea mangrovi]